MEGFLGRLLSFDKMIASFVIKALYYILLVVFTLFSIWRMLDFLFNGYPMQSLYILLLYPIGILVLRLYAELLIVVFRISENLAAIRKMKETEGSITE